MQKTPWDLGNLFLPFPGLLLSAGFLLPLQNVSHPSTPQDFASQKYRFHLPFFLYRIKIADHHVQQPIRKSIRRFYRYHRAYLGPVPVLILPSVSGPGLPHAPSAYCPSCHGTDYTDKINDIDL